MDLVLSQHGVFTYINTKHLIWIVIFIWKQNFQVLFLSVWILFYSNTFVYIIKPLYFTFECPLLL